LNGDWYFEGHVPLEDDLVSSDERLDALLGNLITEGNTGTSQDDIDHAREVASIANGVPARLGNYDADEVFARARRVRNIVEIDPDAPTLSEVRALIDEANREAEDEAESM
jgi:hypothetical protein